MMKDLIKKVKEKKEFSELPDSIISRALEINSLEVKETRAFLRKYFGVFLTNKVLKGKGEYSDLLKSHISSKKREYEDFYFRISSNLKSVGSIIDLGSGVNGFSYPFIIDAFGKIDYMALEASGQLVRNMNSFFEKYKFPAKAVSSDLFDLEIVQNLLKKQKKNRVIFLFQVIDALENLQKDFSLEFLESVSKFCEFIVLSFPTESLGGRKKFVVRRAWLIDFLEKNFEILEDFEANGERVFVLKTR